jgi:Periplasmic binding protein domain
MNITQAEAGVLAEAVRRRVGFVVTLRHRIDADTQHCHKTPRIGQIQADGRFKILWSAAEPVAPELCPLTRTAAVWRALLHDLYTGWGNRWAAPED